MSKRYKELLSEQIQCPLLEPKRFGCNLLKRRPLVAYCHLGRGRPIGYDDFNPVGTITVKRSDFRALGITQSAAPLISLFPRPEIDVGDVVDAILRQHPELNGESLSKDVSFDEKIRTARAHGIVSGRIYRLEETGMIAHSHAMKGNYNEREFTMVHFLFGPEDLPELKHDPTMTQIQNTSGEYVETYRMNLGDSQPYNVRWSIREVGEATLHQAHLESVRILNGATNEILNTPLIQLTDLTAYIPEDEVTPKMPRKSLLRRMWDPS